MPLWASSLVALSPGAWMEPHHLRSPKRDCSTRPACRSLSASHRAVLLGEQYGNAQLALNPHGAIRGCLWSYSVKVNGLSVENKTISSKAKTPHEILLSLSSADRFQSPGFSRTLYISMCQSNGWLGEKSAPV